MRILCSLALSLCFGVLLPAQMNAPQAGLVLYPDGNVYALRGLPSNLIVNNQALASASAIAFSDSGGWIASKGQLSLVRADRSPVATYSTIEAAPVLNIGDSLDSATAWLPSTSSLLYSDGISLTSVELHDAALLAHATSIRRESHVSAVLLVSAPGGAVSKATVSLKTGDTLSLELLPGVRAPAFFVHSSILFPDKGGLRILSPEGELRTVPLAPANPLHDLKVARMSITWYHLSSASSKQEWALYFTNSGLLLSELPGRPAPPSGIGVAEASK